MRTQKSENVIVGFWVAYDSVVEPPLYIEEVELWKQSKTSIIACVE